MTTRADLMLQTAHASPNPSPSQVTHDIINAPPTRTTIVSESGNTSDCDQLLLQVAVTQHSFFPSVHVPAPGAPARAKRPRTLAYPRPDSEMRCKRTKTSTPMGTSKHEAKAT